MLASRDGSATSRAWVYVWAFAACGPKPMYLKQVSFKTGSWEIQAAMNSYNRYPTTASYAGISEIEVVVVSRAPGSSDVATTVSVLTSHSGISMPLLA